MKEIPLSQGKVAVVDDEDYEGLIQNRWCAMKRKVKTRTLWYAARHGSGPRYKVIGMHQQLLPQAREIDHRDGNGLNNQRSNLREATRSQNRQNQRKQVGTTSRFKGVYWHKTTQKWAAAITENRKLHWLGVFPSEEDAAKKYDAEARRMFGEFALPNFS